MGNPLSRFLDLIRNPSYSRTTTLLVILTIALSIPLTVFVAQKQQELRQQAAFDAGGGGSTECEQKGGYCDNGTCAKFISHCLYDATVPSNCINPGASCTPAGGINDPDNTAHRYQCSELQPYSCSASIAPTPQPQDTCTPNGGSCTFNNLQACEVEGGSLIPGTCSSPGKVCCKIPSAAATQDTCTPQGGSCTFNSRSACELEGSILPGATCSSPGKVCCKIGAPALTCQQNASTAVGCPVGCKVVNGKNLKCNIQNKDASGQCSAACSGAWNCVEDPICPQTSTSTGGSTPTPACNQPPSGSLLGLCGAPLKANPQVDIAVCNGKVPDCSPNQLVKRQADGSLYCFNPSTNIFVSYATCPATSAPASGNTRLSFTIGLDGLGKTGDFQSRQAGRNEGVTPRRNERGILHYQVFDPRITDPNGFSQEVANNVGKGEKVNYDAQTGKFKADVNLGKTLTGGNYIVKVRVEGYLAKIIRDVSITTGQQTAVPVDLITGDVDKDNKLTILDYNILRGCFGKTVSGDNCLAADLDDTGTVDQFDYNLFLREFTSGQREGDQLVAKGE